MKINDSMLFLMSSLSLYCSAINLRIMLLAYIYIMKPKKGLMIHNFVCIDLLGYQAPCSLG